MGSDELFELEYPLAPLELRECAGLYDDATFVVVTSGQVVAGNDSKLRNVYSKSVIKDPCIIIVNHFTTLT